MSGPYAFTPYLWPLIASILLLLAVALFSWRRRGVAGAGPFAVASLVGAVWMLGVALEIAAVALPAKFFWYSFRWALALVPVTAMLCFAIEYAGQGYRLTRRTLVALAIPPLLLFLAVHTNDAHHLQWADLLFDGHVERVSGPIEWVFMGYGYLISFIALLILIRLFIRSPLHRVPAALVIAGLLLSRVALAFDVTGINFIAPLDLVSPALAVTAGLYFIALFRFQMFSPIPVARQLVIEQMGEGMLVLDNQQQIVYLNRAAEAMVGAPAASLRGRDVAAILPGWAGAGAPAEDERGASSEISLGAGQTARQYVLYRSPLRDQRGRTLGQLLLLHDVTEQKRAQTQLLQQQRAVATLQERERLARELHDSAGQVLGYVSMQAQAISKRLRDGELTIATAQLDRLVEVAQEAHNDIRESIFSLKAGAPESWAFLDTLRHYLDTVGCHYGIDTGLMIRDGIEESDFEPFVGIQLLRVIQETLTNARQHGGARHMQVDFAREDGRVFIVVTDDGHGFDAEQAAAGTGGHFGLDFMRERMAGIDGSLEIDSHPGAGTRVLLHVPAAGKHEGEG